MMLQRFLVLLCCWLSLQAAAQAPVFTTGRFGPLKLNAPLDSVNAYLDKKVSVPRLGPDDDTRYDSVAALLGGIPLRLVFQSSTDTRNHKQVSSLTSIYSEDRRIATRSGISPGLFKFELVRLLDGSVLTIAPDTEKGKGYSRVQLLDSTNNNSMFFYFRDNLLYAIEILFEEYYDC